MTRFDETIHMVLNHTLDAVLPAFREIYSRHDLTEQQWRVLRVLWDEGRVSFATLGQKTLIPRPSLVGVLSRLEGRGLVKRERSKEDRRNVSITITAKGQGIAKAALPVVNQLHIELREALTEKEWSDLIRILAKIRTHAGLEMELQHIRGDAL